MEEDNAIDDFEEFQAKAFTRHRGRRSSRSLPSTPKGVYSPNYEKQLANKLDNVSVSEVMRRRKNLNDSHFQQRSYSCKQRRFNNHEFRPRTSSMPSRVKRPSTLILKPADRDDSEEDVFHEVQRVRTFSSSEKGGIVNRGDSFKRKTGRSSAAGSRQSSVTSQGSSVCSTEEPCTVLIMGPTGVGKSSLIQQFTTSEYMGGEDASMDGETQITLPIFKI